MAIGWTDTVEDGRMDIWTDKLMNEWMDSWVDVWMDGWIDIQYPISIAIAGSNQFYIHSGLILIGMQTMA